MSDQYSLQKRVIGLKPVTIQKRKHEREAAEQQSNEKANQLLEEAEQELVQARQEAQRNLEAVELEISAQRNAWQKEKESLVHEAYQEGFDKGIRDGQAQGYQEYSEQLAQINHILSLAQKDYASTVSASEEMILELAVTSAEKIINAQLVEKPEYFLSVVKKVIEEVREHPEIVVYVHPDDYELIQSQKGELESITSFKATLTIYINDSQERFGCMIESPFGRVEAGIDHQLTQLREKLHQLVQEEKNDE
ncbi:flagellar assembly protein FliH [Halobacillus naozhouensis]|uniref:Flagellar assembly protein FliH n=1 Tax=Halobacillus naozhouensis TaxID=554880 RepID=A0ABY8J554_9BACI|nr:flagellar assembly protein FliH [Halobacillus naozhouensis]WFT76737.1 flagellar assembly protein FliH [Halobacillus naozhouensis]